MARPNKEINVLELFLNEPTKHWHFNQIVKEAKATKGSANTWLRKLSKEKIIKRIKPQGKKPYFIANENRPNYDNRKRIYALTKFYESGLLEKLQSLKKAKTIVIFGSFGRGDWDTDSDVDVFIYGDPGELEAGTIAAGREIQVHSFKTKKEIKDIGTGLINNVVKGIFIKGNIHDIAEVSI